MVLVVNNLPANAGDIRRVGHDLVTECIHTHTHTHSLMAMGRRNDSMNKAQE